jgi:glyoxylase-like metal-dependent hydrolase (beta-lactamase superfamily II)
VRYRVGDYELHLLRTGRFRLDGGSMFGIVPKPLWERQAPADARNRIGLAMNCLLVRGAGETVVIDAGAGDKYDAKAREMFALETEPAVWGACSAAGAAPDEIDRVILTHLHFDHAGGGTRRTADGTLAPTFPNARYVVQRGNLEEEALTQGARGTYYPENWEPLLAAERLDLLEGDTTLAPGISTIVTGGHQKYHQAVKIESRGERALFPCDLVPTAAHVNPPWIMAYDHYPLETLAAKRALLGAAADERWLLFLCHEVEAPVGRVARDGAKFRWEPVAGERMAAA